MIATIAIVAAIASAWEAPTPDHYVDGLATYYSDGVFARVAANRGIVRYPGEFPGWLAERGYVGAVALNRKADLGRPVWIQHDGITTGPFFTADCAALHHYQDRIDQNRIIEVDWQTAQVWGMTGPVPVRVLFMPPAPRPTPRYTPE